MALQIVPSQNPPAVRGSLILAFAGIPQPNPLRPNGRVFRKLAGPVPPFGVDGKEIVEMTYEEAFTVRFMRWMPAPMQREFGQLFESGISGSERASRMEAFMPKLTAHKKACPPPWETEVTATGRTRP